MARIFTYLIICFLFWNSLIHAQLLHRDWASYFGGSRTSITQVELDKSGKYIYLSGYTADTGIATLGAYQTVFNPIDTPSTWAISDLLTWKCDAFIAKFDVDGELIWSTYIGGRRQEMLPTIALDNNGNVLVYGLTKSVEGIATPTAHINEKTDTFTFSYFLMKFDADGNKLWGTYYDISSSNTFVIISPIAIDIHDNIYIGGVCDSFSTGIATMGAYQPDYNGGDHDGFIAKFDKHGNRLWSTFIGGSKIDAIGQIHALDSTHLYIFGSTTSTNNIGTIGTYQSTLINDTVGGHFIMRLNPNTGHRIWGTYVSRDRMGLAFSSSTIDKSANIYLLGDLYFESIPSTSEYVSTPGTHQSGILGGADMVLMKFDSTGNKLWGSYYGGYGNDLNSMNYSGFIGGSAYNNPTMSVSSDGSQVFFAGYTSSNNGIDEAGCGYVPTTSKREGFIANFNGANGQLHWDSYFDAEINDIEIDESNPQSLQIYFATRTHIDSLATPGSFKENKSGLLTAGLFGKLYVACPLATPSISYSSPQLTVDGDYESYTWYHNGTAVSTGDSDSYAPGADTTGYYFAMVEKCGCTYYTDTFYFDDIGIRQLNFERHFRLYPNPTTDQILLEMIDASTNISAADIQVYNLLGQLQRVQISQPTATNFSIGMQQLPAGAYLLQVRNTKGIWTKQVVKW